MEFHPLTNLVLVSLDKEILNTGSVIVVQHERLIRFGIVTAIGPEVRDVKVGHRVLASIVGATEIGQGSVLVSEDAIQGIVHE